MLYNYNVNQTTLKILALFRTDYKKSLYLRKIARDTRIDVKAISFQLNRLEKANILTSAQNGKNKEYSLNLSNYLTLYHLVLAETFISINYLENYFEIKKIVKETTENLGKTAILFGSFAKENMTPESDIDILILDNDKKAISNSFREAGSLINREINVKSMIEQQFLDGLASNNPLVHEVVENHIILKGIDNLCNILWRYYAR